METRQNLPRSNTAPSTIERLATVAQPRQDDKRVTKRPFELLTSSHSISSKGSNNSRLSFFEKYTPNVLYNFFRDKKR
jgi:hypothetical protein